MNINAPLQGAAIALPFTKAADPTNRAELEDNHGALRIPLAHKIPDDVRNHFVAMCGEYVGTTLFLFFALAGTQVANNIPSSSGQTVEEIGSNPQQLQYIALSFGFSLAVNAWVFFRISGGLFNPAVTVGMCIIGALPYLRGVLLFASQILGGMTAAALVACMFPGPLTVQTTLGGGTSIVQGLFIEMLLTAELVFTIFMLAAEKHKGTFIAPVGIGLSLFVAELVGVYFTGGSLNPARSFGPCVVDRQFNGYHWTYQVYWVGPILGSIVAAGFYKFIKILEYETANPNQDAAERTTTEKKQVATGEYQAPHSGMSPLSSATSRTSHTYGDFADRTEQAHSQRQHRPQGPVRAASSAVQSPAMGTADDAFAGLSDGGMHAGQNTSASEATQSPGMVVSDGMIVRRLGRGASYAA
ncbi:hypothetical protein D0860_06657 [Hortaea werneckii]|uniref:Aquaporin n=1 Tax=Hortaea werneckii TaxID=91943 RepID=A0A3M7GT16_HORWE|nr:hypothetical protein D0860_06657 [Hortaea werneckii]